MSQTVIELHAKLAFDELYMVAHCMRVLVARSALLTHREEGARGTDATACIASSQPSVWSYER